MKPLEETTFEKFRKKSSKPPKEKNDKFRTKDRSEKRKQKEALRST